MPTSHGRARALYGRAVVLAGAVAQTMQESEGQEKTGMLRGLARQKARARLVEYYVVHVRVKICIDANMIFLRVYVIQSRDCQLLHTTHMLSRRGREAIL